MGGKLLVTLGVWGQVFKLASGASFSERENLSNGHSKDLPPFIFCWFVSAIFTNHHLKGKGRQEERQKSLIALFAIPCLAEGVIYTTPVTHLNGMRMFSTKEGMRCVGIL